MSTRRTPSEIVTFWREAGADKWFSSDPSFDAEVRDALLPAYLEAMERGVGSKVLHAFETSVEGTLALVILLDQVPRNVFRGTPRAFASDPAARAVAERAQERGIDEQVEPALRGFLYLPFMHAEDLAAQEYAVALYERLGDAEQLKYAIIHRDIIARFGRFPHRNPILGRTMSQSEAEYLAAGGFSG
ncbi:MAG: DUF924 family protein [Pseudomonadota bacterium]